jgi:hypothetical protein
MKRPFPTIPDDFNDIKRTDLSAMTHEELVEWALRQMQLVRDLVEYGADAGLHPQVDEASATRRVRR